MSDKSLSIPADPSLLHIPAQIAGLTAREFAKAVHAPPGGAVFPLDKAAIRLRLALLMLTLDVLLLCATYAMLALLERPADPAFTPAHIAGLIALFLLIGVNTKAYGFEAISSLSCSLRRAWGALWLAALIMATAMLLLAPQGHLAITELALLTPVAAVSLLIVRRCGAWLSRSLMPDGPTNKLVVCDGMDRPTKRGEFVVRVDEAGIRPSMDDPMMLDRIGQLARRADRIVVCCPPARRAAWSAALRGTGVDVELLLPELKELEPLTLRHFDGSTTAMVTRGHLSLRDRVVKRTLDLLVAIALLPGLLLAALVIAILIKLDDGGPVFFVQMRVGQGNRLFHLYKFRTMRVQQLDPEGVRSTRRGDDRVTRVGRILRSTSLDELPQFFNVLRGDMSLVGPRPHALGSLAGEALFWEVDQRYWHRHAAKPGLTGLAQIRGFRGSTALSADLVNRLQADLEYVATWSLRRDLRIILATFGVLVHRNAF
jgi:lipopolysaccharide/colanic/teichoic acid biosynthesis glycosyltransferase